MNKIFYSALFAVLLGLSAGCHYSPNSGLPKHIKTVEVSMFHNKTFYKGLEGKLTRAIIDRMNLTPGIRVVNSDGDAQISGEIVAVNKTIVRADEEDRPTSINLVITVEYSFYDNIEQRFLVKEMNINSSNASAGVGLYSIDRGEARASAEAAALEELGKEIVRNTAGMW